MELTDVLKWSPSLILFAFILDLLFGDPVYRWHPIRLIGNLLSAYERLLRHFGLDGYGGGVALFVLLAGSSLSVVMGIHALLAQVHDGLAWLWDVYIAWSTIALGDLGKHGRRIANAVTNGDLESARYHVGMLVGRDLHRMSAADCCRAAVESVSENLTDGVISPLFYLFCFGIPGAVLFKVISTMDSMVGYKTPRYLRFGWCGARLDDVANYIPARLTWLLMIAVGSVLRGYHAQQCLRIGWEQHHLLPGPNSGWAEAGAAGALGLQLIGPIWLHGELVTDIWIGNPKARQQAEPEDVYRMIWLATVCTVVFVLLGCGTLMWLAQTA
jgi:adenosylcobinamide-phosphate synthase